MVLYIPDIEIKIIDNDPTNTHVKFVKPEELSNEEIVCKIFREGSLHPIETEQGALGGCAFFAMLSSLADNNPDFIKENLIEYGNDFVIVKFFNFEDGTPIYIMPRISSASRLFCATNM